MSLKHIIKQVQRNDPTLLSVTVHESLTGHELRALCDALQSNEHVTSLALSNGGVALNVSTGVSAGAVVAEMLQFNTSLRRLALDSMRVDGDDVAQLAASLATNELASLRTLSLSDNSIEPHGLIAFSAMLSSNTTLRVLWLAGNELLDAATVQHLARALSVNSTLEELDMWKPTPFNDIVTMVMSRALKSNRALRWLRFNASTSSADVIASFTEELRDHNFVLSHVDAFAYTTDELDDVLKRNKALGWPHVRTLIFNVCHAFHGSLLHNVAVLEALIDACNPLIALHVDTGRKRRCIEQILAFTGNPIAPNVSLDS